MYQPIPLMRVFGSPQDRSHGHSSHHQDGRTRFIGQSYSERPQRQVQNSIVYFDNFRNQARISAIKSHSQLIIDLRSIQPASISEIASESGQSTSAARYKLNQLINLELVKRVRFEHHTLFCINGSYNLQIAGVLTEFYGD